MQRQRPVSRSPDGAEGPPTAAAEFLSTHWSLVLAAGDDTSPRATEALEQLCRAYWYPLYAYVRRRNFSAHEAQDLTQEFFARLLRNRELPKAGPEKGRFRFFLLLRLKHFLINEWERLRAEKRGGGRSALSLDELTAEQRYALEPSDSMTPDRIFERRWAITLLENVLRRLREEWHAAGKEIHFETLKVFLSAESWLPAHAEIGARLGLSEGAVKVAVHRLRERYRALIRDEIAQTVASPAEVDDELRHLLDVLREPPSGGP
jgi:RNA polymerase sigma-70 factor (ECF subfamily)